MSVNTESASVEEQLLVPMGKTNVKYCPIKFLGKGGSAIVYPGFHYGIVKPTAVKLIENKYLRMDKDHITELKIWSEIDQNVNIIRLYDSYKIQGGMFLAMEKAERTFREQILKYNPVRNDIVKWLHQVSSAVEYLHEKRVIHRDIKPDNILMVLQDRKNLIAKLADFGVSKIISNADVSGTSSYAHGTILWRAPEANTNQSGKFTNTRMLDIYALGMVIYFGLSKGGHPFSKCGNETLSNILSEMTNESGVPLKLENDTVAANDLISIMLQRRPENRPKIFEVLSHCFFWNWEKEQMFLIRVAITLSRKKCDVIEIIKDEIDKNYLSHYEQLFPDKIFNWIEIAKERGSGLCELFNISIRKDPLKEYKPGTSIAKFLKFFRDKFVHHPDMTSEAVSEFSQNDGIFCEEKYVKILISICPDITAILYQTLQKFADKASIKSLSNIYFPRKIVTDDEKSQTTESVQLLEEVDVGQGEMRHDVQQTEVQSNVEQDEDVEQQEYADSDVHFFSSY